MGRDLGCLVDQGLHLARAVDELLLGEGVDYELPVIRIVGASRHPGDHVVPAAGCEGRNKHEFRLFFTCKAHNEIVGAEGARNAGLGEFPYVLLVVEGVGILHVIGPEDLALDGEKALGVAPVGAKGIRSLLHGREEVRENPLPGPYKGILLVGNVEGHIAVVGVDGYLDAVADVIDASA